MAATVTLCAACASQQHDAGTTEGRGSIVDAGNRVVDAGNPPRVGRGTDAKEANNSGGGGSGEAAVEPRGSGGSGTLGEAGTSTAPPDAENPSRENRPPTVPDAGAVPMVECSPSVLHPTEWADVVLDPACPSPWGCDRYEVARRAAARCTTGRSIFTGRWSDLFVIRGAVGGFTIDAYYARSTGALIGYFQIDDVGAITCSGRVPEKLWTDRYYRGQWPYPDATDVVSLCSPDGSVLVDAGRGGRSTDAGDAG